MHLLWAKRMPTCIAHFLLVLYTNPFEYSRAPGWPSLVCQLGALLDPPTKSAVALMVASVGVLWLKRDLRTADHAALSAAAASGLPLVILFVWEPSLCKAVDFGRCHLDFINESLQELDASLQRLAGSSAGGSSDGDASAGSAAPSGCAAITIRHAEAVDALAALHAELAPAGGIKRMWSHEETGTPAVMARNAAVREWADREGVEWTELPQTGAGCARGQEV